MERKEIKELAKSKIKGNKWNIWWPLLVISVIEGILNGLFGPKYSIDPDTMAVAVTGGSQLIGNLVSIVMGIVIAGYMKYILDFVRTGKFDSSVIIETVKKKWVNILIATILVGVIVGLCSILFVIPGIIMALAYSLVMLLVIDTDVKASDALKQSRELMKGHKWEYFVFGLSFIGWVLLIPCTLGLILIWLAPYMIVASVIYLDNLMPKTKKSEK
ncbi:MAG: DUF975 family protein [Bacilli bacterium]|nr:DUF975 family protein [Bacilli bacterium]